MEDKIIEIYYKKCIEYIQYRINHERGFALIHIRPIIDKLPKRIRGILRIKIYKFLKYTMFHNHYTYKQFKNCYVYW